MTIQNIYHVYEWLRFHNHHDIDISDKLGVRYERIWQRKSIFRT